MENFFLSAESRWFLPGSYPPDLWEEFRGNSPFAEKIRPETRTDQYLVFPHAATVGVKIRNGKLEIKTLTGSLNIDFPKTLKGNPQSWEKWSYEGKTEIIASICENSSGNWLPVEKTRILRFFDANNIEHPPGEHLANGYEVEVAGIKIGQNTFWSVAIEAFGKGDIPPILEKALHFTFGKNAESWVKPLSGQLTRERSYPYPALFHKIS